MVCTMAAQVPGGNWQWQRWCCGECDVVVTDVVRPTVCPRCCNSGRELYRRAS